MCRYTQLLISLCCFVVSSIGWSTTLDQAMHFALNHSPSVTAAKASEQSKHFRYKKSLGNYFPKVDLAYSNGYINNKIEDKYVYETVDSLSYSREVGVTLAQNLFQGGHTWFDTKDQWYGYQSEHFNTLNTMNTTKLQVVSTYLEILKLRAIIVLDEKNIANHQDIFKKIAKRVQSTLSTKTDHLLATTRLQDAQKRRRTNEDFLATLNTRYLYLVGKAPPANMAVPSTPALFKGLTLAKAVDMALSKNPELKASHFYFDASKSNIKIKQSAFYPKVNLAVSAFEGLNSSGTSSHSADLDAIVTLSWNVFHGGEDYYAMKSAAADNEHDKANLAEIKQALIEQVNVLWADIKSNAQTIKESKVSVTQNTLLYEEYLKQFSIGKRNLFELLDMQSQLNAAKIAFTTAKIDRLVFLYNLSIIIN